MTLFLLFRRPKLWSREQEPCEVGFILPKLPQKQAQGMEMGYEEVIRLLEAEIAELKAQLADYSDQNKVSKTVLFSGCHGFLAVAMCILFSFFSSALLN